MDGLARDHFVEWNQTLSALWTIQGSLTEGDGLSTIDLLSLTSLDQLLYKLKVLLTISTKQGTLMRRSTVQSLPPQLVFPGQSHYAL